MYKRQGFCNAKVPPVVRLGVALKVGLLKLKPLEFKPPKDADLFLLEPPSNEKLRVRPVGLLKEKDVDPNPVVGFVNIVPIVPEH